MPRAKRTTALAALPDPVVPSLHRALHRVLPVARADTSVGSAGLIAIRKGRLEAYDGRMFVSCPVDLPPGPPFAVNAGVLGKAVTADSQLEIGDKIVVRTGRFRTTLHRLDETFVPLATYAENDLRPIDTGILADLMRTAKFVGDGLTQRWTCNVIVRDGVMLATNNLVMVRIEPLSRPPFEGLIPAHLVQTLRTMRTDLPTFAGGDERSVVFAWPDHCFLRALRIDEKPSESIFSLLDDMHPVATPISEAWRAAYRQVNGFDPERPIHIDGTRLSTQATIFAADADVPDADALGTAVLDPRVAEPILAEATHLDLHPYPERCYFSGDRLLGLFMPRKP